MCCHFRVYNAYRINFQSANIIFTIKVHDNGVIFMWWKTTSVRLNNNISMLLCHLRYKRVRASTRARPPNKRIDLLGTVAVTLIETEDVEVGTHAPASE